MCLLDGLHGWMDGVGKIVLGEGRGPKGYIYSSGYCIGVEVCYNDIERRCKDTGSPWYTYHDVITLKLW